NVTFAAPDRSLLARTCVGAPGGVTPPPPPPGLEGTNDAEAFEGPLVPFTFVSVAKHVYVLPLVRPDTWTGLVPVAEPVAPAFEEEHSTVNFVNAAPEAYPGLPGVKVTSADPSPGPTAAPMCGGPGGPDSVSSPAGVKPVQSPPGLQLGATPVSRRSVPVPPA